MLRFWSDSVRILHECCSDSAKILLGIWQDSAWASAEILLRFSKDSAEILPRFSEDCAGIPLGHPGRTLGEALGGFWEGSGRALGGLWESSGRALGSRGLQRCLGGSLSINWHHSAAVCKSSLFSSFYEMFLKHRSPGIVNYNSKRSPVESRDRRTNQGSFITTARTLLSLRLCLGNMEICESLSFTSL